MAGKADQETARRDQLPLTTATMNKIAAFANDRAGEVVDLILGQKQFPAQVQEDIRHEADAIEQSVASALEQALFGAPSEEVAKETGMASVLDIHMPTTFGELKTRLKESGEYAAASFGQIRGKDGAPLGADTLSFMQQIYDGICEGMSDIAGEMSKGPGPRGVK